MQELADAEAELRSIPAEPTEEQANQRAIKQAQIDDLTEWLELHGGGLCNTLSIMQDALTATEQPSDLHAVAQLGFLCAVLIARANFLQPLPTTQQEVLRGWLLCVDAMFTRLCSVVPRLLSLPSELSTIWADCAFASDALQLIPVLHAHSRVVETGFGQGEFLLTSYCERFRWHSVCLEPYLRMFEFGLDPAVTHEDLATVSALQLAHDFVRDHPALALHSAADPTSVIQTALEESRAFEPNAVASLLPAYATHQHEPLGPEEDQRRRDLHARFMRAVVAAWLAHSTKVRSLLLDAAPGRLIPPLVDVVARYLDLERTPPERVPPVEEKAEMDN